MHQVTFDLPTRELGKADVHFLVKQDGSILGKLEVSKGAIVWYPKNKKIGHKIGWTKLDDLARDYPRIEHRKAR